MNRIIGSDYTNETVLEILRRQGIYIKADCGGKGHCGKCKVRFFDAPGAPEPSPSDIKALTGDEIKDGYRLACTALIHEDKEIMIPDELLINEIEWDYPEEETPSPSEIVAVDYGTYVISGALVDLNEGIVGEARTVNHQRAYGRPLRARVQSSVAGYGEEMRRVSLEDLADLSARLGRDPEKTRYIVSGSTVMQHMISGFPLDGFMKRPGKAVDISMRRDGNLTMLPGIGAFTGPDLVSAIAACNLDITEKPWMLLTVDAGTGMAIGTGKEIYAAYLPYGYRTNEVGIYWKERDIDKIRTGIEMFINEAGLLKSELEKLVLSGSFDDEPGLEPILDSGIIPEDMKSITGSAGNASLTGASLYVLDTGFGKRLKDIAGHAKEITLDL